MNKVISFAAILALSAASEEFGDNDLNILKTIGHDLKKAGEFVVQHPQIITTAAKFLDDEAVALHRNPGHDMAFSDEELNILTTIKTDAKKAGHFIAEHPELITKAAEVYKTLHKDDDIENELNIFKKIGDGLKKAGKFVVSHPQIVTTAAKFLDDEAENELNVWTTIKNDAKKVGNFIGDHPQIITEGAKVYKTLKHDDELNVWSTIKNDAKKVGHFVADHPQIITTAAKFLDNEADDELNVWTTIKNDAKKVGNFVADHPQVVTEAAKVIKTLKHDDEFNAVSTLKKVGHLIAEHLDDDELNVWSTIKNDAKKAGHFVADHPQIITTAAKFLDDEADDELNVWSTIKNDAKKVGNFIADHPQVVTEGAKVYKTLKHDDEFNAVSTLKKVGHLIAEHLDDDELFAHERTEQRVHEGVKKAQRDVRAASEALKNLHHQKRAGQHDSLSNLGELLHEGHRIHRAYKHPAKIAEVQDNHLNLKDAANWIGDHAQVITEGAKTYKILKGKH